MSCQEMIHSSSKNVLVLGILIFCTVKGVIGCSCWNGIGIVSSHEMIECSCKNGPGYYVMSGN